MLECVWQEFSVTGKGIALQDDTLLDASVDLDIFAKKNQKITLVAKLERIPISHGYNVTGHLSAKGKVSYSYLYHLTVKLHFVKQSRI